MKPTFSIITATYNSAKFITETYESIHNQTVADWESFVTDDFSSIVKLSVVWQADKKIIISENNMVELVRDLRSTLGYGSGEFKTFAVDCGSIEFEALVQNEGPFQWWLLQSAIINYGG